MKQDKSAPAEDDDGSRPGCEPMTSGEIFRQDAIGPDFEDFPLRRNEEWIS
jgi:hypothetical protein